MYALSDYNLSENDWFHYLKQIKSNLNATKVVKHENRTNKDLILIYHPSELLYIYIFLRDLSPSTFRNRYLKPYPFPWHSTFLDRNIS